MRIARVFPTRTSMSPDDEDAYFDVPPLFLPRYDEVHVSVSFTWDLKRAEFLRKNWERVARVRVGGVAIDGELPDQFTPWLYVKRGNVITSRGCPNRCRFCAIRNPLKELLIHEGRDILDNNLLACSESHIEEVFRMLRTQKDVRFSGGLEARRITDEIIDLLKSIKLDSLFIAYDRSKEYEIIREASIKLTRALPILQRRHRIRCFVLCGFGNDTIEKAEKRMKSVLDLGLFPFAMLYRDPSGIYPHPEREWRKLQRLYARPALSIHKISA